MDNLHEKWMYVAIREAKIAEKNNEVPIGAVIIKNNNIISKGYNQVETLNDSTAHAEMIAITSAANTLNDWRLNDCTLYVTKQPCLMCFGAIMNSRISKLFYGMHNIDLDDNFNMSELLFNSHLKYIKGGILLDECKGIVQNFFLKKR